MKMLAGLLLPTALLSAGPAAACRWDDAIYPPYREALLWLEQKPEFEAVVEVEVAKSTPMIDGRWTASGRRTQTRAGQVKQSAFEFGRREVIFSGCGRLVDPPPSTGEHYVLYLSRADAGWTVQRYLPAALVDGNFGALSPSWRGVVTPSPPPRDLKMISAPELLEVNPNASN